MSKSKQMKREYNQPTHTDAFTWLENSGECGQEVLKYIRELERTTQIKAVQAVANHFDNIVKTTDDIHHSLAADTAFVMVTNYINEVLQVEDGQRAVSETV